MNTVSYWPSAIVFVSSKTRSSISCLSCQVFHVSTFIIRDCAEWVRDVRGGSAASRRDVGLVWF